MRRVFYTYIALTCHFFIALSGKTRQYLPITTQVATLPLDSQISTVTTPTSYMYVCSTTLNLLSLYVSLTWSSIVYANYICDYITK